MIRWPFRRAHRSAMSDPAQSPAREPEAHRFTVAEVDRVLLGLSELERAVYLNHRKGGLSYVMIAQRLGISPDAVEQIMAGVLFHLIRAFDALARERRP